MGISKRDLVTEQPIHANGVNKLAKDVPYSIAQIQPAWYSSKQRHTIRTNFPPENAIHGENGQASSSGAFELRIHHRAESLSYIGANSTLSGWGLENRQNVVGDVVGKNKVELEHGRGLRVGLGGGGGGVGNGSWGLEGGWKGGERRWMWKRGGRKEEDGERRGRGKTREGERSGEGRRARKRRRQDGEGRCQMDHASDIAWDEDDAQNVQKRMCEP